MRNILPFIFSLFLVFTALAETTYCQAQDKGASCPAVCLSTCCAVLIPAPGSRDFAAPSPAGIPAIISSETVFVHRLSVDEIFHPPAV